MLTCSLERATSAPPPFAFTGFAFTDSILALILRLFFLDELFLTLTLLLVNCNTPITFTLELYIFQIALHFLPPPDLDNNVEPH